MKVHEPCRPCEGMAAPAHTAVRQPDAVASIEAAACRLRCCTAAWAPKSHSAFPACFQVHPLQGCAGVAAAKASVSSQPAEGLLTGILKVLLPLAAIVRLETAPVTMLEVVVQDPPEFWQQDTVAKLYCPVMVPVFCTPTCA